MKSEKDELPSQSQAELDSAVEDGLYDFIYVDKGRVSALYAQLFPQGTISSVKTTEQSASSADNTVGGSIPSIFKAEHKLLDSSSEGIERMFDATWVVPLEVLSRLNCSGRVRPSLSGANLGSIVSLPGYLRLIDYAGLKDIWEPALGLALSPQAQQDPNTHNAIAIVRGLPHTVHAHFLTRSGWLWSSLDSANLMIPAADITLKYGGDLCGSWNMVCILDAYPSVPKPAVRTDAWQAGDACFAVIQFMSAIRAQIGRPAEWFGVTPIMIYRPVSSHIEV